MGELILALEQAGVGGQVVVWVGVGGAVLSLIAKVVSIFMSDNAKIAEVVNVLALNKGKASNDPGKQ